MKKLFGVFTLFLSIIGSLSAQRPIGTWRTFLPWGDAIQVVQSPDRIYCATSYAIFYIEKTDGSIGTLTKSSGLSDADVRHIAYNASMNTLVITYQNSNIDLLVNGTDIYNIPDIKVSVISGSKNINDIQMIGNYAYLATDLGISVLDIGQQQIMSNYIIGSTGLSVPVYSIASDGVNLFAATSQGVKSAPLSSPNLQNYAVWKIYNSSLGLPTGTAASLVGQINGTFYAVVNDTLYVDSNLSMGFSKVRYDSTWSYKSFSNTGGGLYAFQQSPNHYARLLQITANGAMSLINLSPSIRAQQIAIDGNTEWIADIWKGLLKFNNFTYSETIVPDGPPDNGAFRITAANNVLYMAAGGTDNAYIGYNNDASGPIIYNHTQWQAYSLAYNGGLSGCLDLVDVAVDNSRHKAYYASLQGGLVEVDLEANTAIKYDASNSILGTCVCGNITKISALCLDQSGNLWMSNTGTSQSLVVKRVDSTWSKYSVPNDLLTVRKMTCDSNGYIWIGGRTASGNMVIFNPADSQFLNVTTSAGNGNLPNSNVWAITPDKEGNIWVGTDVGIGTFYCTGSLFSTPGQVGCDATWIKVDQGGFIGYLFSTQIVQALAVDGADRKWVGTTNGIWLISADGTTQLLNFNTDNSPLLNNSITDIAVDQQTGEVWIGTADGLVSYQGDAIRGGQTKGTALVYPNPVKSDYTGPIAIKGLVDNAYVKITDAAGILVYQGQANGGEMIWNGRGYSGNKVSTGIYMVYADAADGSQHNIGKIIFIK